MEERKNIIRRICRDTLRSIPFSRLQILCYDDEAFATKVYPQSRKGVTKDNEDNLKTDIITLLMNIARNQEDKLKTFSRYFPTEYFTKSEPHLDKIYQELGQAQKECYALGRIYFAAKQLTKLTNQLEQVKDTPDKYRAKRKEICEQWKVCDKFIDESMQEKCEGARNLYKGTTDLRDDSKYDFERYFEEWWVTNFVTASLHEFKESRANLCRKIRLFVTLVYHLPKELF